MSKVWSAIDLSKLRIITHRSIFICLPLENIPSDKGDNTKQVKYGVTMFANAFTPYTQCLSHSFSLHISNAHRHLHTPPQSLK